MLGEATRRAAAEFSTTPAFVADEGWSISYSELDHAADEGAAGLLSRGIGEGSVVALALPSTIDYVVLYLALARVGAVTVGLNPRLRPHEIATCLEVVEPSRVFVSADLLPAVKAGPFSYEELATGVSPASVAAGIRSSDGMGKSLPPDLDRPVCICFTSGSTGQPKGAWFTDRQLRAIAEMDSGGAWAGGGHGMASTQFAHVGFMTKLPWMIASGRTTHLTRRWSAGRALQLIADHHMAAVAGIAPQIALMLRDPAIDELEFSSVKAIVAGGAASPPALVKEAQERFDAPYTVRYSSTESGGIGLASSLDDPEQAIRSVGRPRTGVDAEIRDPSGSLVPDGEVGELWLRSGAVMEGYWNDPAATAEALVDGWLRTGDLGAVESDGCIRITGRLSEMYIRGGYNVFPAEVEAVLAAHPMIAEVAIVPGPHPVMGEIGVAVVVPNARATAPSLDDLRGFARSELAHYKLPEAIRVVEALPRSSSDKIDRLALIADDAERRRTGG